MRIEIKQLTDLHPASYNPRKDIQAGDPEYERLKRSINEFGYVEPIIWNERTGHVIGGHQRLKVLQEQGVSEAECVIVDFDEGKEKALNVALNKITNKWDIEKLSDLLEEIKISGLNLEITGFSSDDIIKLNSRNEFDFEKYRGDHREKVYDFYRLHEYDEARTAGYYNFPTIKACHVIPAILIPYNERFKYKRDRSKAGIHFFIDDNFFEQVWRNPYSDLDILREYQCVIMPDFSTYYDMPIAMKIWNVYRMRTIAQIWQDEGLEVIYNVRDYDIDAYEDNFIGVEPGGVIACSTMGLFGRNSRYEINVVHQNFFSLAVKCLKPECVISYGAKWPDYDYDGANVVWIKYNDFHDLIEARRCE